MGQEGTGPLCIPRVVRWGFIYCSSEFRRIEAE